MKNKKNKVVQSFLGKDVEASRGYYSCSLGDVKNPIQVGIIINQRKELSLLVLPSLRHLVFGHDQSISVLDLESDLFVETIPLEGMFFEFFRLEIRNLILALHELGCVALSEQGEVLWRHVTDDILEDWKRRQ